MGMFLLKDNQTEADPEALARGKAAYEANCSQCHGVNADGAGPDAHLLSAPPTNFASLDYKKSPSGIAAHIAHGKRDAMPAFDGALPEKTIWDMANYLHSLQQGR